MPAGLRAMSNICSCHTMHHQARPHDAHSMHTSATPCNKPMAHPQRQKNINSPRLLSHESDSRVAKVTATLDTQETETGRQQAEKSSRRTALLATASVLLPATWQEQSRGRAWALPLAPLGNTRRVGGDKQTDLSAEQVKDILAQDLAQGMYFVTGNLTREIFDDNCAFVDPTNSVSGLSRYLTALGILFDPQFSKVLLMDIKVTGPKTIEADWQLGGWLRNEYFPWQAKVDPFQGHTVYSLSEDGLVIRQEQTWSISPLRALQQTFTPAPGPRAQLL